MIHHNIQYDSAGYPVIKPLSNCKVCRKWSVQLVDTSHKQEMVSVCPRCFERIKLNPDLIKFSKS